MALCPYVSKLPLQNALPQCQLMHQDLLRTVPRPEMERALGVLEDLAGLPFNGRITFIDTKSETTSSVACRHH